MRALLTGGTGFIGRRLLRELGEDAAPRILSRNARHALDSLDGEHDVIPWNPEAGPPPKTAFDDVEVVYNLMGEPIAGRWSREKKRRIRDSRVRGTRNLVDGLEALQQRPSVLITASAIGVYGDRDDDWLDESAVVAGDFLADVCAAWEREALRAEALGVRVVLLRTGLVLGPGGGIIQAMVRPFKMGLGARLGDGKQWMSWIHIDDLVAMLRWAAREQGVSGVVNAVSPNPVTNESFTRTVAAVLGRTAFLGAPSLALRAALGETASLLLFSQRVRPAQALAHSFSYQHPELEGALRRILRQ